MWIKRNFLVLLFFFIATIAVTFPLILHLDNWIVETGDGLLITWIMNWNIHSFFTNILNIYNTNIFHPYTKTLAFSDLLFLQSLIALPFITIFEEPILAFNINLLVGFILTGFSFYLLCLELSKKFWPSFLGGIILTFSPLHFNFLTHQQLFHLWPVILTWYFLIKKQHFCYVIFFLLSSWSTVLFVYFLALISLIYKKIRILILALLISSPFLLPYFLVSREWHYVRPITDAIHFSLQIPDVLNPHYFGLVFFVLLIFVFVSSRTEMLKQVQHDKKLLLIVFISFVLALGPALHIFRETIHVGPIPAIPLPYAIFYYLVPGFAGFRAPSRWIWLCFPAMLAAIIVTLKNKFSLKIILILIILVFAEISLPLKYYEVPKINRYPEEISWLKNNFVGVPIIYFPVYNWDDLNQKNYETERMLFSTQHWHPMFNGYSGFTPEIRQKEIKWLQKEFPSIETISFLKDLGTKLIIVPNSWSEKLLPFSSLKSVVVLEEKTIYSPT